METTRPNHIEVADHFFHDSVDLLKRYELCITTEYPDFSALKSRRMKCFIDLRMALESALKAVVAYYHLPHLGGEKLVKKVESFRHHLDKLLPKTVGHLPEEVRNETSSLCEELNQLPVGLRYRLDVFDFIGNHENLYYSTIGSDTWLSNTAKTIWKISKYIGDELSNESRLLSAADVFEEMREPRFEKYKSK